MKKENKNKNFFHSLLQLTILVYFFRQSTRFSSSSSSTDLLVSNNSNSINHNRLLFLNYNQFLLSVYDSIDLQNIHNNIGGHFGAKESRQYAHDLGILNLIDKINNTAQEQELELNSASNFSLPNLRNIFLIAPASFNSNSSTSHTKDSFDLSETRLLLNSIELNSNNNQLSKEDIEMDIDLQTIIQQDIDLGIEKSFSIDLAQSSQWEKYNLKSGELNLLSFKDFEQMQNENLKNTDILETEKFFEHQPITDGYKLVLEEDTGECFLILVNAENNSVEQKVDWTRNVFPNSSLIHAHKSENKTQTEKAQKDVDGNEHEDTGDEVLSVAVCYSIYDSKNNFNDLQELKFQPSNNEINREKSATSGHCAEMRPQFLSQTSINNLIDTYSETPATFNTQTSLANLDESLNVIGEANLLNETWLSNYIQPACFLTQKNNNINNNDSNNNNNNKNINNNDSNNNLLENNQSGCIFSVQNHEIDIKKNQSLLSLNMNQSVLNDDYENQTFIMSPPLSLELNSNINNNNNNSGTSLSSSPNNLDQLNSLFQNSSFIDQIIIEETEARQNSKLEYLSKNQMRQNDPDNDDEDEDDDDEPFMSKITDDFETLLNSFSSEPSGYDSQSSFLASSPRSSNNYNNTNNNQYDYIYLNSNTNNRSRLAFSMNDAAYLSAQNLKKEKIEYNDYRAVENSAAVSGLLHNHTYLSTENSNGGENSSSDTYHPYSYKNKLKKQKLAEEMSLESVKQQENRDEQLLRAHNIQLELSQVIDSSADELNELIKTYSLDREQVNILKDIRRRGKNKVAAQICRKRKLDSIESLKEDVDALKDIKAKLKSENGALHSEIKEMTLKFDNLYRVAIANSNLDANDPVAAFINNLKAQFNIQNETESTASKNVEKSLLNVNINKKKRQ